VIGAAAAAAVGGYTKARSFVRNRLRYVDAVRTAKAPVVAGLGATLIAAPVVALLPLIGAGTAIIFGVAVGTGVRAGVKDITRGEKSTSWLNP
jgi:hypothetical protein